VPKVASFSMGSKDAPQKMQFLGAIKKVASLGAFIQNAKMALLYKTQKWRKTSKDSAVTEAK